MDSVFLKKYVHFQMSTHAISLYPVLFETLSNNSDEVVIEGLTVLAEIVNCTNKSKGKKGISLCDKYLFLKWSYGFYKMPNI